MTTEAFFFVQSSEKPRLFKDLDRVVITLAALTDDGLLDCPDGRHAHVRTV